MSVVNQSSDSTTEATLDDPVDKQEPVDSDDNLYIRNSETELTIVSAGDTSSTGGGLKLDSAVVIFNKIYVPPMNKEYSSEENETSVATMETYGGRNEGDNDDEQPPTELSTNTQEESTGMSIQVC